MHAYDERVEDHKAMFASLVTATQTADGTTRIPCASPAHDAEWWHRSASTPEGDLAKRLCRSECPVAKQCLRFALATNPPEGIWGGLSKRERTEAIKRRKRQRRVAA